ncbi:excinuclease ABC subunit A [Breznakia sp. PF5-3]|uniref:excinuclease ABC subunit UvrA n=1 Tax=unclassified Breznakia TaxID=2623764 RepID=UPI002406E06E|nr:MULTISPECIES: excinuclease ABC subunit UvrA [unclassified Breznakia]MDF9824212.1 excinuclease ABC subunit A [Breznakia sp. PM6-1]MDF9835010.1 excinuclease ABC subunit A [Breznakia sp. PF5-3]MDF9837255.1 excinuclease ABC subunit A [Breznakia sp. PFB2-8]MDF9859245.1 excinuclease ABC subunit A [Breznakia sp. PH5-24]
MEIRLSGVREKNLKNISLTIPKNKLVLFTGVSGSGKTSLVIDTLYQESQRQYLEAIGYQGIQKPDIDYIRNTSPAVVITQTSANRNPRSSVGTQTNIYTDLRMIYEKLGKRKCPNCGNDIYASKCKEEVEFHDGDFTVYMYCNICQHKMHKLTRSYFSYNTKEGACPTCQGLGEVLEIDWESVIDESLTLEEGAIKLWKHKYKDYQITSFYNALSHFEIPYEKHMKVKNFSILQKQILQYGIHDKDMPERYKEMAFPKTVEGGKYEGIASYLWKKVKEEASRNTYKSMYFKNMPCPACHGERLQPLSREVSVLDTRLPELVELSMERLYEWLKNLETMISEEAYELSKNYIEDAKAKLQRIMKVGLGYLTIDQQMITLSGGEAQRIKIAATLDSDITGILYILDEPTVGLHAKDTDGMIAILKQLRDLGNTVIVVEHDIDVMKAADIIIDLGPGAGEHGGKIIGKGTYQELQEQPSSITGQYLKNPAVVKTITRSPNQGWLHIKHAHLHNLKYINVDIPKHCLSSITGVSGSGKSSLIFGVLHEQMHQDMEDYDEIITIYHSPITRMKRSNVATYAAIFTDLRMLFASTKEAKEQGYTSSSFSFNTKGGRCEHCEGLGYVESNMLFFENINVVCPVCKGKQYTDEVLNIKWNGKSIRDVLHMEVSDALHFLKVHKKISERLQLLEDVGLGYLKLGQSLNTLSGGEGQRLKLASELMQNKGKQNLYLIDEPTTGLHPLDVEKFILLLNRIVDYGNTVIVVEHNQQIIKASDWIIDLGPYGGERGGELIATGTPEDIKKNKKSITGRYL